MNLITLFCLGLLLSVTPPSDARDIPPLTERIIDHAHVLSPSTHHHLSTLLQEHERQTTQQIAILTIPNLDNDSIEEFSHRVASTWKLGSADLDNGVLVLLARDNGRIRIEVGYGLEGTLTDARSRQLLDEHFLPAFRQGQFNEGMLRGITALLAVLTPRPIPHEASNPSRTTDAPTATSQDGGIFLLCFLLLMFLGGLLYRHFNESSDLHLDLARATTTSLTAASLAMAAAPRRSTAPSLASTRTPTDRLDPWERLPETPRHHPTRPARTDVSEPVQAPAFLSDHPSHATQDVFTGHGGEFGGGGASADFDSTATDSISDSITTDT